MVNLSQRVNLQVIDNNLTNATIVENYINYNGDDLTISNFNNYIDTLSASVDKVSLECFNLRDSIGLYEEDYNEDAILELEELEDRKKTYGDLLDRMYDYSSKLNIEI